VPKQLLVSRRKAQMALFVKYMDDFITQVEKVSLFNENFGKMLFMVCLSQMVDKYFAPSIKMGNNVLRYRLSVLLISPSRSGKGQATKVAKEFLTAADVQWVKTTQFTDAGMIGTIDKDIAKLASMMVAKGAASAEALDLDPIIPGDLKNYRVIFFDEAKSLVVPGKWTQNIYEILQEALDDPGIVRKKLSDKYPITYETHVSIVATTYYLKNFHQTLMEQGFFQRILVLVEQISPEQRKKLNDAICLDWTDDTDDSHIKNLAADMLDRIHAANKECKEKGIDFIQTTPEARKAVKNLIGSHLQHMRTHFSGSDLEVLMPFTTGCIEKIWKMGAMSAILDNRYAVSAIDIANVKEIIGLYLNSIMNEILANVEQKTTQREKYEARIMQILKTVGEGGVPKTELYRVIQDRLGLDYNRVVNIVRRMIDNGSLLVRKEKPSGKGRPKEYISPNVNQGELKA